MKTKQLEWVTSFEEALELAKESGKPIYIDFFNPD